MRRNEMLVIALLEGNGSMGERKERKEGKEGTEQKEGGCEGEAPIPKNGIITR